MISPRPAAAILSCLFLCAGIALGDNGKPATIGQIRRAMQAFHNTLTFPCARCSGTGSVTVTRTRKTKAGRGFSKLQGYETRITCPRCQGRHPLPFKAIPRAAEQKLRAIPGLVGVQQSVLSVQHALERYADLLHLVSRGPDRLPEKMRNDLTRLHPLALSRFRQCGGALDVLRAHLATHATDRGVGGAIWLAADVVGFFEQDGQEYAVLRGLENQYTVEIIGTVGSTLVTSGKPSKGRWCIKVPGGTNWVEQTRLLLIGRAGRAVQPEGRGPRRVLVSDAFFF